MARIKSVDTKPEIAVRKLAHAMGFRFRLHRKDLPGKPDLVFSSRSTVLFVHGCFWHQHEGCRLASYPKSRTEYWHPKLAGNQKRDALRKRELKKLGWKVSTIWECQTKDLVSLEKKIKRILR